MIEEDRSSHAADGTPALGALGAASREKADAYLDAQTTLARLQAEDLRREDRLRHWSLRVHHISDVMKLTFELTLALIATVIIVALAAAFWSAAHDDGVVIEAFSVPPDMAQRGLTGSAVSSMLLDRLMALQAQIDSSRAPSSYASKGDDIKVLIPDTGISISDAYRYLVGWLGHQTHVSGDVYRTAKGIVLVVRTSGHPGASFEGSETGLGDLTTRAAEAVYRQTQPFRYGVHLLNYGRVAEADAVFGDLTANGPASEKPWAYAVWMYTALVRGDLATMISRAHTAAALDHNNLLAQMNASQAEATAGHDEQELRYDYAAKAASAAGGGAQIRAAARVSMEHEADSNIAEETGDFAPAVAQYDEQLSEADFVGSHWTAAYLKAVDLAKLHNTGASRRALGSYTDAGLFARAAVGAGWNQTNLDLPQFQRFAALGDWADARKDIEQTITTPAASDSEARLQLRSSVWPLVALARAKTGDAGAAWAAIGKTSLDCYLCLRVRGQIAGVQRNWSGAAYWFARAVAQAPSIPFAYTDWGAMLLVKGDPAGAIAKFTIANHKGPHFADPLQMWGEALIRENRSDLALAKFAEADKYAPQWGRLHLKWGEALWWSGRKDEARKQYAVAAGLDLAPSDRSELANAEARRG
ncbi:MAG TPA: hypothetical protein VHU87_00095 [Rhizomicrobium sp.]|jgi:hypothetical protein|nr:hypothetical protein [Rhizomicrobium sp.]